MSFRNNHGILICVRVAMWRWELEWEWNGIFEFIYTLFVYLWGSKGEGKLFSLVRVDFGVEVKYGVSLLWEINGCGILWGDSWCVYNEL